VNSQVQRRGLGHAPGTATGAKSTLPATDGNQLLRVALLAAHVQEAVLQAATGTVGVELLLDEVGQRNALLRKTRAKLGEILIQPAWRLASRVS
jgi:hypothetical protein